MNKIRWKCEKLMQKLHKQVPHWEKQWWFHHRNMLASFICVGVFLLAVLLGRETDIGYNLMLLGVVGLFLCDIMYCLQNLHQRFLFLLFLGTFFTFLLGRPVIDLFRGNSWHQEGWEANFFSVFAQLLTLVFLRVGNELGEQIWNTEDPGDRITLTGKQNAPSELQVASFLLYLVATVARLLLVAERLVYMRGRSYAEYYLFSSRLPYYVDTIASMATYGLAVFFATLPKKRICFFAMVLYILGDVPSLLLGARMPFITSVLFAFVYYLIRDYLGDEQKWIGKWEKRLIAIGTPSGLLLLGAFNYLRDGAKVALSPINLVIDFFHKQGVSFHVLQIGYNAIPNLPDVIPKNYTFGPFTDYIFHGTVAQRLFGALPLGSGNSAVKAVYGNSFADSMSYVAHPKYLEGNGWGSSYLLETYADWGYLGIVVFSILIGLLLASIFVLLRKGTLVRAIVFCGFFGLFIIPRSSAMGWLQFVITIRFWLSVLACYGGAWILSVLKNME